MKNPIRKTGLVLILSLLLGGFLICEARMDDTDSEIQASLSSYDAAGCTVIYGRDDENVLGGNNEDFTNPDTRIWFLPPEAGKFGRVLVGYDNFIWQGGMNDQGLFFDAMSIEEAISVEQGDKPKYQGSLPSKALESCADVNCVLELFDEYHAYDTWVFQFLFGDASGNSVLIEPHQVSHGGRFLVGTNFLQSTINVNDCRYCDRYWTARSMFENSDSISIDLIRDILDATHLEDDYPTQYSTIYDLKEKKIYLYLFHNFEEVKEFDLDAELEKGYRVYEIGKLFEDTLDYNVFAWKERERLQEIWADFYPVEPDPLIYDAYLGSYQGPDDLDMAYDYYSIDYADGELVLKWLPDKAWMRLVPTSETEFFHISFFDFFEIEFLPEENGEVNRFVLKSSGQDYDFERIYVEESGTEEITSSTFWSTAWSEISRFAGTNTFKFLAIIVGLVVLQLVLKYLRSLLA